MKDTADAIREMVAFFLPHCADQSTLSELKVMASDANQWREARISASLAESVGESH